MTTVVTFTIFVTKETKIETKTKIQTNTIHNGDALTILKQFPDNTFDSIVTDPPYGISFMNKHWDYDVPKVELWQEVLRVLKPGGYCLVACGTRTQHRMAVNLEDAGFEIRDLIAWIYGSGFPKSLNVGKAVDKIQGNEREIVGEHPNPAGNKAGGNSLNMSAVGMPETAILTKGISEYEGYGTALKPASEYWTLAYKPISDLHKFKKYGILDSIEKNLNYLIWQSLKKLEKTDTYKLLENGLIPLSIALLWHCILEELYKNENTFTTSTVSKPITELKILNSLLSQNTQDGTDGKFQTYQNGMKEYQVNGLNVFVSIAEKILADLNHTKRDSEIITSIVTEIASLKIKNIFLNVQSAEKDLKTLNATVSSVLQNVLIGLIGENKNEKLNILVKYAEKLLQLSLAENQNSAEENVWQKHLENISPDLTLWTLCRKPLSEKSIAENVLKWGTGGINIDGCRVGTEERTNKTNIGRLQKIYKDMKYRPYEKGLPNPDDCISNVTGRFPANIIHDGSEEVLRLFPETKSVQSYRGLQHSGRHGGLSDLGGNIKEGTNSLRGHNDSGSASRFFYSAKASKSERNAGLEGFEEKFTKTMNDGIGMRPHNENEPTAYNKNHHPTVKPISLMRYLCRLITPKNGTVLDPFMGSGSTGIGAVLEGFNFVGIEREKEYCDIAEARIEHYKDKLKLAL